MSQSVAMRSVIFRVKSVPGSPAAPRLVPVRPVKAIASLKSAIEADVKNASAYDQLGTIQVQQGRLDQAASTYRSLVRNQPSAAAHRELAQVLARLGHSEGARKELEIAEALERGPVAAQ